MLGREPALWVAFIAALIQAGWMLWTGDANGAEQWATPLATMLAGVIIRQKVIPTETVRDAGISPDAVQARANNPSIAKHEGK